MFNGEKYIQESIESVLGQTKEDFELIVADNCSTDHTHDIAIAYNDPRMRVLRNDSNIGSLENFNRCIELAHGEYFVLLPHDDVLLPTMLDTFSRAFASDPTVGLAYSSYYIINEQGDETDLRVVAPEDKIMRGEEALQMFLLQGNPIQCAMVRRSLFSSLGSFDPTFFAMADIELWCRIALAGNKVACFTTPQNCFRVRPDSGQQSLKSDTNSLQILSEHLGFTPSQNYIRNNTLYMLAFKYLKTLFNKIPRDSNLQKLRAFSAKQWIFGSLIKCLITSLLQRSWVYAWQEINLLFTVFRWAGFWRVVPILLGLPFEFVGRRFRNRWQK